MPAESLIDEIVEIADTPEFGIKKVTKADGPVEQTEADMIEHRRLRIDTRKWAAAKMAPKKYGEKSTADVNVNMSIEELVLGSMGRWPGDQTHWFAEAHAAVRRSRQLDSHLPRAATRRAWTEASSSTEILSPTMFRTGDVETDRLLETARQKILKPHKEVRQDALEKLWDAFERQIPGEVEKALKDSFGSIDKAKEDLIQAGVTQFGSGRCWLTLKDGVFAVRGLGRLDLATG